MNTVLTAALAYLENGWSPIPLPQREKNPGRNGWQTERLTSDDVERRFNNPSLNIGILLGEPSNGLIDVDLDCPEALDLWPHFLPKTGMVFGRKSRPQSHHIYTTQHLTRTKKLQFDGKTLVELRSTGCQTLFPESTHPDGEKIRFDERGEPTRVDAGELESAVDRLAAASLLAPHWPQENGVRHHIALALAGTLLRAGWSEAEAAHFIRVVAEAANDEEAEDRIKTVDSTAKQLANGKAVTGTPALAELLGNDVVSKVVEWLQLPDGDGSFSATKAAAITERFINIQDWTSDRYAGEPPQREWLVEDVVPLGVPVMLAAIGDTGKSNLLLKLGLAVAVGTDPPEMILGGTVLASGTVVIVTSEEDKDEIHRRLDALDPDGRRFRKGDKLIVVPLPDAGGPLSLVAQTRGGPRETAGFQMLREQLVNIPDLALVGFDPLQSFVHADINKDPAAGQFVGGLMGSLAVDTGATVITTHHMRKPASGQPAIKDPAEARDAIRGTTALVDGMRCAYAMWPVGDKEARKICKKLDVEYQPNRVVKGAVVKSNGPANRSVRTLVRDDNGVLIDWTEILRNAMPDREGLMSRLRDEIAAAAARGHPFTKTGQNGVYKRRSELPEPLRGTGRDKLGKLVQDLLDERKIVACRGPGNGKTTAQWLDVPDGPLARGESEFAPGDSKVVPFPIPRNPNRNEPDQE